MEAFSPDLIVIACQPDELLELLDRVDKIPLIVASNTASLGDAARYIRLGPHDVVGPGDNLAATVVAALELRRSQRDVTASQQSWRKDLIGSSPAMERLAPQSAC